MALAQMYSMSPLGNGHDSLLEVAAQLATEMSQPEPALARLTQEPKKVSLSRQNDVIDCCWVR